MRKLGANIVEDLNEIFDKHLGQNFEESLDDRQGCSMGRANGTWLCPKLITELVIEVLESQGVELEDEDPEPDVDPENVYNQGSVAQSIAEDRK